MIFQTLKDRDFWQRTAREAQNAPILEKIQEKVAGYMLKIFLKGNTTASFSDGGRCYADRPL